MVPRGKGRRKNAEAGLIVLKINIEVRHTKQTLKKKTFERGRKIRHTEGESSAWRLKVKCRLTPRREGKQRAAKKKTSRGKGKTKT